MDLALARWFLSRLSPIDRSSWNGRNQSRVRNFRKSGDLARGSVIRVWYFAPSSSRRWICFRTRRRCLWNWNFRRPGLFFIPFLHLTLRLNELQLTLGSLHSRRETFERWPWNWAARCVLLEPPGELPRTWDSALKLEADDLQICYQLDCAFREFNLFFSGFADNYV